MTSFRRFLALASAFVFAAAVLVAPVSRAAAPLLLQWGTIDTGGAEAQAESATLKAKVAKKAAAARKAGAAAESRAAYVVQFPGPVLEEWRTWLESATQVRGYLPEFAYLVWATPTEMDAIAANENVFWTGEWKKEYKTVRVSSAPASARSAAARWMQVGSLLTGDDGAADLRARLEALPADVRAAFPRLNGSSAVAWLTDAQIDEVAAWPDVEWIEPQLEPRLCNDQAARDNMLNVSNAWAALSVGGLGLTGAGQIVAVADTGLDKGSLTDIHADFTGRVVAAYGWANRAYDPSASWADTHSHGTHVCGSILGTGAKSSGQYKGMAHEAKLVFQGMGANLRGLPVDTGDMLKQAYDAGARIHSDSWGYGTNFPGQYNYDSVYVDIYTWENQNFLAVIAAGNDGVDANADGVIDPGSVSVPGTAKNCLCVGAAENYRSYGGRAALTYGWKWSSDYPADPIHSDTISSTNALQGMAAFSGRGPTADGRFKPDIVAPGTDIISVRSRVTTNRAWGVAANTNYLYMGGTSMATPLASGATALVRQWLVERQGIDEPMAALMKALLINGARDMTPGQYGAGATQEITARPDFSQGFGHVDLCNSLDPGEGNFLVFVTNIIAATDAEFTTNLLVSAANAGTYRLTLAWQDYPAAPAAAKTLVNDLDLIVTSPSGTRFYPNKLGAADHTNNIEFVEFEAAETGNYAVRVYGTTIAETEPNDGQPFALVMSGPVTGEPAAAAPRFAVSSYADEAILGKVFRFDFKPLLFVKGYPEPEFIITSSLPSDAYEVTDSVISFTPDFSNDATFECVATNDLGGSTCTLTVSIAATPPAISVSCGSSISVLVDSEVDFTVTATGNPTPELALAAVSADSDIDYDFDPDEGYFYSIPANTGTATFTFTATSPLGVATATVEVVVSSSALITPTLTISDIAVTSARASWTPCTYVTNYILQLASDDQFTAGSPYTLTEDFSKVTASNTTAIANLDGVTQTSGWTGSQVFSNAEQTVRIGTGSKEGWLQTPAFAASGNISVIWSARRWSNKDASTMLLGFSEDGGTTFADVSVTLSNSMSTYTHVFPCSGTSAALRWKCSSSSNARFILDDIAISAGGGSTDGSILLSADVADTVYPLTGLAPSTTYHARVRGAYSWSSPITFTTLSPYEQWLADNEYPSAATNALAGNGQTYYWNYVADIDPTTADELLIVFPDPSDTDTFSVENASSNRWYQLVYSTNLLSGFVTNNLGPGSSPMTVLSPTLSNWFGRLRVTLPP